MQQESKDRLITWQEVGEHNKYNDVWFVIEGNVYDPTPFLPFHPGGDVIMQNRAGQDATRDFLDHGHSKQARNKFATFKVGTLDTASKPAQWQNGKRSQNTAMLFSFSVIIFTFVYAIWVLSKGPIVYHKQ